MPRKLSVAAGFLLLLALVAKPVWDGREEWHIGQSSDDGVYWLTAKSLATGHGYRVLSLPGTPYAVKYPPLYPAFLSIAWRIDPEFPGNVRVGAVMQACLLPIFLALLLAVVRRFGFSWRRTFLVAAITVVTLQMVALTITLFSELLCLCLLLGSMLFAERSAELGADEASHRREAVLMALAAGLLAGLAYLARNAVLPILGAGPLFFFLKRKPRLAGCFLLLALPLAASWHVWTFTHGGAGPDPTNASYFNEYLRIIRVNGLWSNFLKQLASLSGAVADNFTPGLIGFLSGLPLYHVVLAAAISGGIRIGRRCDWPIYLIFSGLYCVMILFWWYEGIMRLIIPAWPALVAGIAEEAAHVATLFEKTMARSPFWSAKSTTWKKVPRCVLFALGIAMVIRNDTITWKWVATAMKDERRMRMGDLAAFSWIADHKTPETIVLAWKDTTSFLYTGAAASRGLFIALTPQTPQLKAVATSFSSLPPNYTRGLLLLLRSDLGDGFTDDNIGSFASSAKSIAGSKLEFSSPGTLIYSFPIPR